MKPILLGALLALALPSVVMAQKPAAKAKSTSSKSKNKNQKQKKQKQKNQNKKNSKPKSDSLIFYSFSSFTNLFYFSFQF